MAQQGLFGLASPYEAFLHGEGLAQAEAKAQQESFIKMLEAEKSKQDMTFAAEKHPIEVDMLRQDYATKELDNLKKVFEQETRDSLGTEHYADKSRVELMESQQKLLQTGMSKLPEFGAVLKQMPAAVRTVALETYLKQNGLDKMVTGLENVNPEQLPDVISRLGNSMAMASRELQAELAKEREMQKGRMALESLRQKGAIERAQIAANARQARIGRLKDSELTGELRDLVRQYHTTQDPAEKAFLERDIALIQARINQISTATRGDKVDIGAVTGGAVKTNPPPQVSADLSPVVPAQNNPTAPTKANAEATKTISGEEYNSTLNQMVTSKINPATGKKFTKQEAQQALDAYLKQKGLILK